MDEYPIFTAPTGRAIAGLAQCDEGIWPVYWTCDGEKRAPAETGDVEYVGDGPDVEWQSVEWEGLGVYQDEGADAWLAHHLIPAGAEPLSKQAIEAARNEVLARERAAAALALAELLPDGIDKSAIMRLYDRQHSDARLAKAEFVALRGDA